jgi:recA bacterial DNA recombination protein
MATNGSIVDLRNLLAERFPHSPLSPLARLPTGLANIDSQIGGGLPKGAITELISPHISAGSASLIAALLQAAWTGRYFLALVDGRDSFDPHPLGNSCLRHLLWTRCTKPIEAIKAADLLLRDGNFPLVILDLVLNAAQELRKIPSTSWYRLQRLVEPTSTALLIVSRRSMVGSAQMKLVLENAWSLPTLEQANALSQLQVRVQRSQVGERAIAQAEAS